MKKIVITALMLALTATLAAASGLDFQWSTSQNCPTTATGTWTFACNTNSNVEYMVACGMPNVALVGMNAMDARIDVQTANAIPAWWQGFNAGACRQAAFSPSVLPSALTLSGCTQRLWTTDAYGGIGAWAIDGANRFHIVVGYATAGNRVANLSTTARYNAFQIAVLASNTVADPGDPDNGIDPVVPCAGCADGATLVLNQITYYGNGTVASDAIVAPLAPTSAINGQCLLYNGGAGSGACGATPARNTTWGQVKSLYR